MLRSPSAKGKIQNLSLQGYAENASLDNLVLGVDNIRIDVTLSPQLQKSAANAATYLIARFTESESILDKKGGSGWIEAANRFKKVGREVMVAGLKRAKAENEAQIDLLTSLAITKMVFQVVPLQYQAFAKRIRKVINRYENSHYPYQKAIMELKEKMAYLKKSRDTVIENVCAELMVNITDIQHKDLFDMRRVSLGRTAIAYEDLFTNPILTAADPADYNFLLKEYVPVGNRAEDLLVYGDLAAIVRQVIRELFLEGMGSGTIHEGDALLRKDVPDSEKGDPADELFPLINGWMKHFENMDILFNSYRSEGHAKSMKNQPGCDKRDIQAIKQQAKEQAYRLDRLYRRLQKADCISKIVAYYEMQPVYQAYCPPLSPSQILKFLTTPGSRRNIYRQFKKCGEFYDRDISLAPLKSTIHRIARTAKRQKKIYLVRFLKRFARYHRDYENNETVKALIKRVHLISDEKTLRLSRTNNTLYEFLLADDDEASKTAISHHTVIKADVRSSTEIVRQMKKKGLNPASFFSLNFFNPITKILPEFEAEKVFIEGDAIILSTEERETGSGKWLGVARACGLAIGMLHIVHRYNQTSKKHQLPVLEVGIGIGYMHDRPTYLFDGEKKIMISPAINKADRMAGCSKALKQIRELAETPFNLFVFQSVSDEETSASVDDLFTRYNVNGIELNASGFEKLSSEIELTRVETTVSGIQNEPIVLYTGVYPTADGAYQRLVIREAPIRRIINGCIPTEEDTGRQYYEVCTNQNLYEMARKHAR